MRKYIALALIILLSASMFAACMPDEGLLLSSSDGGSEPIEYDVLLSARFYPDKLFENDGFDYYIKYYFKSDALIACDYVYVFKTADEAGKWHSKYRDVLEATKGCRVEGENVIKNDVSPAMLGWNYEKVHKMIEFSFKYIGEASA